MILSLWIVIFGMPVEVDSKEREHERNKRNYYT